MARARRRRAPDGIGAELACDVLVRVEVRHDPSYPDLSPTAMVKSRPSQRPASVQKNVKRTGAAWPRAIGTSAKSMPSTVGVDAVSWTVDQPSAVQCRRNGAPAWIRTVVPDSTVRTRRLNVQTSVG